MKRLVLVFALLAVVAACTSDSNLPNPTGKGTIRALNAIIGSPDIAFRIVPGSTPWRRSAVTNNPATAANGARTASTNFSK